MKKEHKKNITSFFNDFAISYRDSGKLRLSVEVEQFIFLTANRMEEKQETLFQALSFNLDKLIVAPPHMGVRESITVDKALKVLTKGKVEDEVVEGKQEEEEVEPKEADSKIKKVGGKKK